MEDSDKVLGMIETILGLLGGTQGEMIAKIILLILLGMGGLYFKIWKAKARKKVARDQSQRDRSDNISDNIRDEDQSQSDGRSVRDRLGRD